MQKPAIRWERASGWWGICAPANQPQCSNSSALRGPCRQGRTDQPHAAACLTPPAPAARHGGRHNDGRSSEWAPFRMAVMRLPPSCAQRRPPASQRSVHIAAGPISSPPVPVLVLLLLHLAHTSARLWHHHRITSRYIRSRFSILIARSCISPCLSSQQIAFQLSRRDEVSLKRPTLPLRTGTLAPAEHHASWHL